ncbi:MAG: hypothetical protein AAB071_05325 [Bacteroidota bacterium]
MEQHLKEKLKQLAQKTRSEIGEQENNVKYKFIIPFLESFGYKDFDFEHSAQGNRIDIFIQSNSEHNILVEAKGYDKNLDDYIYQLKKYCDDKGPILAIISSGEEIRFYSPFLPKPDFSDRILFSFKREHLTNEIIVNKIEKILSKENLENELIDDFIRERQKEIKEANKEIQSFQNFNQEKIAKITASITNLKEEIKRIEENIKVEENKVKVFLDERIEQIDAVKVKYFLPKTESKIKLRNGGNSEEEDDENKRKKAKTPSPQDWLKDIPELSNIRGLYNWADICKHLNIEVGADSARRSLGKWINKCRPLWKQVPDVD